MKNTIKTICLIICVTLTIAGCAAQTGEPTGEPTAAPLKTTEPSGAPTVITDLMDRQVTIPDNVQKIVSLTPSNTEILFALGAGDLVVGRDSYSYYPEDALKVHEMGDYNGPNIEAIVAAEADVVLSSTYLQKEVITQLEGYGITVICAEATLYGQVAKSIEIIGKICGKMDEAAALIQSMEQSAEKVVEDAKAITEKPSLYYVMSYGEMGDWTSGPGSFINTLVEMAGGRCVTENAQVPWVEFTMEELITANPDILLVSSLNADVDFKTVPGYQELDAVKNGNVFIIDKDIIERPGPRLADALTKLGEIITEYVKK